MNVKKELEQFGFFPSKRLGQNFLFDENIARNIVNALDTKSIVVEIGPGLGILSKFLLERFHNIFFIEKDALLYGYLKEHYPEAKIVLGDALKFNFEQFDSFSVISNLPYSISSATIRLIIDRYPHIDTSVLMLQKEVAERLTAQMKSKNYGILTVLTMTFYTVEKLFNVSKNVFYPKPKVDSTVIRLKRLDKPLVNIKDKENFILFIKKIFANRRKKISNNLKIPPDTNEKLGLRAEELSIKELIELFYALKSTSE